MKCILHSSQFNQNWNVSINFSINPVYTYEISRKSVRWAFHFSMRTVRRTERQKDLTQLIVAFHKCFANALKNEFYIVNIAA